MDAENAIHFGNGKEKATNMIEWFQLSQPYVSFF